MRFADYILTRFPDGLNYDDVAQLCLWLHVTLEFCPPDLRQQVLAKEDLADALAQLAQKGGIQNYRGFESVRYGANFHQITDRGHWLEVIASIYKKGQVVSDAAQERVAEITGYGRDRVRTVGPDNKSGNQQHG